MPMATVPAHGPSATTRSPLRSLASTF